MFNVGDRVIFIAGEDWLHDGIGPRIGMRGIVVGINERLSGYSDYTVDFGEPFPGSHTGSIMENNHCWYCAPSQIGTNYKRHYLDLPEGYYDAITEA